MSIFLTHITGLIPVSAPRPGMTVKTVDWDVKNQIYGMFVFQTCLKSGLITFFQSFFQRLNYLFLGILVPSYMVYTGTQHIC